jgi:TatD DNase family protein
MLIDSHCHLDDSQFANDLEETIARARNAGIVAILTAGVNVESSRAAVEIAKTYENVYAVVGIHPHEAQSCNANALQVIRDLAHREKVVGIGEIGLDFHYQDGAPRELQVQALNAQLDLADDLGKPVVIHDRDAHDAILGTIKKRGGKPRGILHCFSGDLAMAREAVELGYLISFSGTVTFQNAGSLRETLRELPLEHVVIETDAPYLSPHPYRGKRNEPTNVARVAEKIAEIKNIPVDTVQETTTRNMELLFSLQGLMVP